jgi:galactan endo-1,6-beta-galactosidase
MQVCNIIWPLSLALATTVGMGQTLFTPNPALYRPSAALGNSPRTISNAFTVAGENLVVSQLGVMNIYANGLHDPSRVGLWTGDGVSLACDGYPTGTLVEPAKEWLNDVLPNDSESAYPAIFLAGTCYDPGTRPTAPTTRDGFVARGPAANAIITTDAPPVNIGYMVTINPTSNWGIWQGWGVSLCWWANIFGNLDDLADILFALKDTSLDNVILPGLGLNIARYNAGGCSPNSIANTKMRISPNVSTFRQIQGYWLDWSNSVPSSPSWNWSADINQRVMLQKAKVREANLLELFSNSPMWWMCCNHNPSGAGIGSSNNLQSWSYDRHAIYLATVAKYASVNWAIEFNSVEPFNEPSADWWTSNGTQEGCHFTPGAQMQVITLLRRELDARGLNSVSVASSDENTYDAALATWNSFDSNVRGQIGRVNVHGYQARGGRPDLLHIAVASKPLWDSEYGDADASGMSLARKINQEFRCLHPTAWCYWQALDRNGWGLIQSTPGNGWIGPVNSKYFVLAQYTRHIRPGMTIIDGGEKNTVAAYDPKGRKLVVVTANYGAAEWITYSLSKFAYANGPILRWMTITGKGASYQLSTNLVISQRLFKAWFPTNTIQTFEIQNVDLNLPAEPSAQSADASIGKPNLVGNHDKTEEPKIR